MSKLKCAHCNDEPECTSAGSGCCCTTWQRLRRHVKNCRVNNSTFDETCAVHEVDPHILSCFNTINSSPHPSKSKNKGLGIAENLVQGKNYRRRCTESLPRLSGLLSKRSSSAFWFQRWKDRWFILVPTYCGAVIHYFDKKSYSTTPEGTIVLSVRNHVRRDSAWDGPGRACFSLMDEATGKAVLLAAVSDDQAWTWISCINLILAESLMVSKPTT